MSAAGMSTRARSARVNEGLWATKVAMESGGVRGMVAKESRWPPASTSG